VVQQTPEAVVAARPVPVKALQASGQQAPAELREV
jgi:hypothetical protein